jgi:electron transport complex protein RnfC
MMARRFRGGTHPDDRKAPTAGRPVQPLELPAEVVLPLAQHIGAPCEAAVEKGDTVHKGDLVGKPKGFVSVPVHASIGGTVKKVEPRPHPLGGMVPSVAIERGESDEWASWCDKPQDPADMSPEDIRKRLLGMGLVGLGGATFPTHVKLSPPDDKPIDTLVINGVECEPYLTSDHRLMLEHTDAVVDGIELIRKVLGVERVIVGIEANKPDAIEAMRKKVETRPGWSVDELPVMYPQGGEKQLIKATLGREVPSGKLPMDAGVVVHNVGTCFAAAEAVLRNRPLIERVVTVTGDACENPGNFLVRLGTPLSNLVEAAGVTQELRRVILGGPMMGLAQSRYDVPVIKGTSGVLLLTGDAQRAYRDCIRCGRCLDGCPAGLNPSLLSVQLEARRYPDAAETNMFDCIECGVCTYVCPSKRPIVHWVKWGKGEVNKRRKKA